MARIKIAYIAGSGRCGSTVLGQLLGELRGFVNIGEGRYLFTEQMRRKGIPCECGASVYECPVWGAIAQNISPKTISRLTQRGRARYFPTLLLLRNVSRISNQSREALSEIEHAYKQVALQSGARVIVDGSKHPTYGLLLTLSDEFDVYVLHLVRSPYGVVASWNRPKAYLGRRSPLEVTAQWCLYNVFAHLIARPKDRYRRLLWESFLSNPEFYLRQICEFLGEPADALGAHERCDGGGFRVSLQHALAGNPDKLKTKHRIELRHSDGHLSRGNRAAVTVLTWPLLVKYGYLTTRRNNNKGL